MCTNWKWHNLVYLIEQTKCGDKKKTKPCSSWQSTEKKTNTKFRSRFSVFIEKKVYAMDEKSHKSCFYGNKVEETVLFFRVCLLVLFDFILCMSSVLVVTTTMFIYVGELEFTQEKLNPGLFGWCVLCVLEIVNWNNSRSVVYGFVYRSNS